MLISDKAKEHDAIVVVFDPSQDWRNRSSIKQYAKVEREISNIPQSSIIYDISLCSPSQCQKIVENFAEKLFEYQAQTQNRKLYLIVFEEAHTYFYQNCMRSKNAVNSVRLLSVGRNVQIACVLISQFASALDKLCVKLSISQTYLGFTRESNDVHYLEQILGKNVEQLTKLNDGEFLYLTRKSLNKISISPFESHVNKTEIKAKIPQPQLIPIEQQKPKTTSALFPFLNLAVLIFFAVVVFSTIPNR